MKVLRLTWSDYETPASLEREARAVRGRGWEYERPDRRDAPPERPGDVDVVLINSAFSVNEARLDAWGFEGLLVTLTNGFDHIDLDACDRRGVTVARTPLARAGRVAEHALACALALCRDLPGASRAIKEGRWERPRAFQGTRRLSDLRVGLVGYGVIGRTMAERLHPLVDGPVRVCDPAEREPIEADDCLRYCDKADLLAGSDLLSLHADLNPTTVDYLDHESLRRLPDGARIVNTARGEMIVTRALLKGLRSGRLGGAALDVLRHEPPDDPLRESMKGPDNLLLTPHAAGFGGDLAADVRSELIETLTAWEAGDPLPHPVPVPRG